MPRNDLPRYSISLTLTEAQLERLEELTAQGGTIPSPGRDPHYLTLMTALAAYDLMVKGGVTNVTGETVFYPVP